MVGLESRKQLADWKVMQRRGRRKILMAAKDPAARAKLIAEIASPSPVQLHISETDRASALATIPAFLVDGPARHPDPSDQQSDRQSDRQSERQPGEEGSFLTILPPEIRDMIYYHAVGYPTCRSLYDSYYDQKDKVRAKIELRPRSTNTRVARHPMIPLRTPTVLLLCKQITREALRILYLQPFVIDRIPPWLMGNTWPLNLSSFISKSTLQNLRFVQIKISLGDSDEFRVGRVWLRLLADVISAWSQHNSLVRLEVMFKLSNVAMPNLWDYELMDFDEITRVLKHFEFKHGSNPGLIRWEHWVLDMKYAYRVGYRNPLVRIHPDPYIWQGNIFEWL
ncbi:hypothetical protein GGR54DRAFT_639862 [Hypoxylon sp. NC1633]|nr:hypothetical protein GGR54DRAFT_639862 [Hypoxylon sp. NC1633]